MTTICCICQKTKSPNGWSKNTHPEGILSHGYCPLCYSKFLNKLAGYAKAKGNRQVA